MRYLSLFSFTVALMLLASCHSSDVALRHSRIRTCISEELHTQALQNEITEAQPTASITAVAKASTHVEATETPKTLSAPSTKQLLPNHAASIASKHKADNLKNAAPKKAAFNANSKIQKLEKKGIVGQISYSFGVVGLVFIIVGIVLLLIGGLIIDTLAALAIAFGFVFILIWLVLAILQGLFDVIL
ncbi:MAG: hypothetical protein K9J18_04500 [Crocinitomicaceae bacterium]|nr:hypothetical protein [Crocinitomicaceae bacterium]